MKCILFTELVYVLGAVAFWETSHRISFDRSRKENTISFKKNEVNKVKVESNE
ncbi:hypothetical protein ACFLQS_04620 [Actinomycetota bacterium]